MLTTMHKVLIGSTIVLCGVFVLYAVNRYFTTGESRMLAVAGATVLVGGGLIAYLRYFIAAHPGGR
jgi:hypothetical protein